MSTITPLMTAEELELLPGDAIHRELDQGELIEMSPAGPFHGQVCMAVSGHLWYFIETHNLGNTYTAETGFILDEHPDTVLAPDFAFIRNERIAAIDNHRGYIRGAPDLVIETMSPSDSVKSATAKANQWLHFGARQCWIVNPQKRTVTILDANRDTREFSETEIIDTIELLPGFQCQVSEFFKRLKP
jgi:Uma2 family endonuclease